MSHDTWASHTLQRVLGSRSDPAAARLSGTRCWVYDQRLLTVVHMVILRPSSFWRNYADNELMALLCYTRRRTSLVRANVVNSTRANDGHLPLHILLPVVRTLYYTRIYLSRPQQGSTASLMQMRSIWCDLAPAEVPTLRRHSLWL
jgi:hypothetical protein